MGEGLQVSHVHPLHDIPKIAVRHIEVDALQPRFELRSLSVAPRLKDRHIYGLLHRTKVGAWYHISFYRGAVKEPKSHITHSFRSMLYACERHYMVHTVRDIAEAIIDLDKYPGPSG